MTRRRGSSVLAMDIGSSSLRTALFTERGVRVPGSDADQQYPIRYTNDGGAELDARALLRAAKACLGKTVGGSSVNAVSASGFWHGLLGLDRSGRPITPIFTWADNRSAVDAARLRTEFSEPDLQLRTGCMLRAPYWPAKLLWLRRTDSALFRRVQNWTSPATWLFAQLFGAKAASHSMASGTGLYNFSERSWDEELCDRCGVRPPQLDILDDQPSAACLPRALHNATIFSAIGDGAASNIGSGADVPGSIAINIGTSAAVRTVISRTAKLARVLAAGLFSYVLDDDRLVIGGAISNAGNLRSWCVRELRLNDDAERTLSRSAAAADTLTVLPHLVSERAPTWPEHLHGTIAGLTPVTSAADILRAATTASYYRLADILDALVPSVTSRKEVIVSGGVLNSPASLKLLADALGRDIRICRELESSLRGAAVYALEKLGHDVTPLRPGKLVRHRPDLADKHRGRRQQQAAFERRLT